jgi:REP element-mobilizing transposase RayT
LQHYDYSRGGIYYVTICSQNRECLFGEINKGHLKLNLIGKLIDHFWQKIDEKYSDVHIDQFIVMPNHLHGLIIIKNHCSHRGEATAPLQSLGKIIAWYKYESTKNVNRLCQSPGVRLWQRNYYDRIIRNENEYDRIKKYILNNPARWESDRNNPNNF